jgi:hypothetical protein
MGGREKGERAKEEKPDWAGSLGNKTRESLSRETRGAVARYGAWGSRTQRG